MGSFMSPQRITPAYQVHEILPSFNLTFLALVYTFGFVCTWRSSWNKIGHEQWK